MKNKYVMLILSFLLAVCLWLYVVTVISPESEETYTNIPVVIQNESTLADKGLMITEIKTQTVKLTMQGKRTDLAKINNGNTAVVVDVSNISDANTHYLSFRESFPGDIADNAIIVQNRTPNKIAIVVENKISKMIPVVVSYDPEQLPAEFTLGGDAVLNMSSINITGPESVIDKITQARIELDLEDRTESINQSFVYTLCDKKNEPVDAELVTTNADAINVELKILRSKKLTLDVTVLPGGGATREDLEITVSPAEIWVYGSDKLVQQLGDTLSIMQIDLSKPLTDMEIEIPIVLDEGITSEEVETTALVTLEWKQKDEATFNVTDIRLKDAPQGMKAELVTKSLDIIVRGETIDLMSFSADDIVVSVSAANLQAGSVTAVDAVIEIRGKTSIIAIGTYSVKVSVSAD